MKLAKALNKASNYNHLSWYIHLLVFVVPRQIFKYGNTWRFSTAPIESRGARLKRLGRAVTNWRSIARTACAYNYMDRRTRVPRCSACRSSYISCYLRWHYMRSWRMPLTALHGQSRCACGRQHVLLASRLTWGTRVID